MLMRYQHLCKSPAIEVYGDCRLLLPWLRVSGRFFCNPELKNCWHGRPGIEPTTLYLCQVPMASQPLWPHRPKTRSESFAQCKFANISLPNQVCQPSTKNEREVSMNSILNLSLISMAITTPDSNLHGNYKVRGTVARESSKERKRGLRDTVNIIPKNRTENDNYLVYV